MQLFELAPRGALPVCINHCLVRFHHFHCKTCHLNAKVLVFNKRFLVFNTNLEAFYGVEIAGEILGNDVVLEGEQHQLQYNAPVLVGKPSLLIELSSFKVEIHHFRQQRSSFYHVDEKLAAVNLGLLRLRVDHFSSGILMFRWRIMLFRWRNNGK